MEQLLALNDLQAGRTPPGPRRWPEPLVESVLEGGDGYMVLDTLRRHSDRARELLARCQAAVHALEAHATPRYDVVHWDFSPDNILCDGETVTGVIDWDGALAGDRLFDLATVLFYAPATRGLREPLVERAGERVLAAYLAHLCVRQAEWSLRLHAPDGGEAMLSYALELSDGFPRARGTRRTAR